MANEEIKHAAAAAGVRLWRIGEALGLSDCNFSRKLRKELPQEEKSKIRGIIDELAREVK